MRVKKGASLYGIRRCVTRLWITLPIFSSKAFSGVALMVAAIYDLILVFEISTSGMKNMPAYKTEDLNIEN